MKGNTKVSATLQLGNENPKTIVLRYPNRNAYKTTLRFDPAKYAGADIEVKILVDSAKSTKSLGITGADRVLGINVTDMRLFGC